MKAFRKSLCLFKGQFFASLANWRVIVGYLIGIFTVLRYTHNYQGYAAGRVVQVFEAFITAFSDRTTVLLFLIGFLIIIADAPFVNHRSILMLYRTSRKQWFWGMNIYIFMHCLLYHCVTLAASMIVQARQGYIHNIWSRVMINLVRFPSSEGIVKWSMPSSLPETLLTDYTPISAVLYTFVFMAMYACILALILFIFNAFISRAVGTALAGAVHMLGYIMMYGGVSGYNAAWSLFNNAFFTSHLEGTLSIFFSVSYMLLVICLLLFLGLVLIRSADFSYSSGEENA